MHACMHRMKLMQHITERHELACLERVAEQAPTAASTSDANCATTAARAKGVLSRNLMRSWAKGPLPSPFMQQGNGPDTAAKPALAAGSCLQRNLQ